MDHKASWTLPDTVEPVWAERRALAAALRTLADRCVRAEPDLDAFRTARALVEQASAALPDGSSALEAYLDGRYALDSQRWIDRIAVYGRSNPEALPLVLDWDGSCSSGELTFTARHGGAPGMVHGGVIASTYDQLAGHCVIMSGRSGFTVKLVVRYRKATRIGVPLRFEARVVGETGRFIEVAASCRSGGQLVSECQASFIELAPQSAHQLFTRS